MWVRTLGSFRVFQQMKQFFIVQHVGAKTLVAPVHVAAGDTMISFYPTSERAKQRLKASRILRRMRLNAL
jgi:hypothetical protein